MTEVKFKKLHPAAIIPSHAHEGDAGLDVFSVEDVVLAPGERKVVATGIASELPPGTVALVWDRSSMATKKGITTLSGVIDCGYRGEWKIVMLNVGQEAVSIAAGDKIAQAIVQPFVTVTSVEAGELSNSDRGAKGFGSTGQ